jgi:hypothetical protein
MKEEAAIDKGNEIIPAPIVVKPTGDEFPPDILDPAKIIPGMPVPTNGDKCYNIDKVERTKRNINFIYNNCSPCAAVAKISKNDGSTDQSSSLESTDSNGSDDSKISS